MRIEELVLEGFKSYPVRTQITGWDPSFNAITGLNGSGKSNILDAICFVLGITNMSQMRAQNQQDLIYKRGQAGITKASVTIVFDNSDREKSPVGLEDCKQITVTRQIALPNISKYLLNGHKATQQTVQTLFQGVQLNINNPNFLIMQGRITKVLNMRPQEILGMVEEAAGTRMFEDRKDKAKKTMDKKDKRVQELTSILSEEITPKLEKFRAEKRQFLVWQKDRAELERIGRLLRAWDWTEANRKAEKAGQDFEAKGAEKEAVEKQKKKLIKESKAAEKMRDEVNEKREAERQKGGTFKQTEEKVAELENDLFKFQTQIGLENGNIIEEKKQVSNSQEELQALRDSLEAKRGQVDQLQKSYTTVKTSHDATQAALTNSEELLQTLLTGLSSSNTGNSGGGYMGQLADAKARLAQGAAEEEQNRMKLSMNEKELKALETKWKDVEKDAHHGQQSLDKLKAELNKLQRQLADCGWSTEQQKQSDIDLRAAKGQVNQLTEERDAVKHRLSNLSFDYTSPYPNFDRTKVKGLVATLTSIPPEHANKATALEIAAGGKLYNVVVEDERVGKDLLQNGKLKKRVTIIPLNKINAFTLSAQRLAQVEQLAPGKANVALSLIGYPDDVARAMAYVFGDTIICADAESANTVTFGAKVRSVTLNGDVYDPSGTLSGGAPPSGSGMLLRVQELLDAEKKLDQAKRRLGELERGEEAGRERREKWKKLSRDVEIKEHEARLVEEQLGGSNAARLGADVEAHKKTIAELSAAVQAAKDKQKSAESDVKRLEKDMREFKDNKEGKINELKGDISKQKTALQKQAVGVKTRQKEHQTATLELEQMEKDIQAAESAIRAALAHIVKLEKGVGKLVDNVTELQAQHAEAEAQLQEERATLTQFDNELKELEEVMKAQKKGVSDADLNLKRLDHEIGALEKEKISQATNVTNLEKQYVWIREECQSFGKAGSQYDFGAVDMTALYHKAGELEQKQRGMKKKINPKVMNMIETVEKKENEIRKMMTTVLKDKEKIEETIAELDRYKRDALQKTWEKVDGDFGGIFAELLPGNFAKLQPPEGQDLMQGLEVKVRLGSVWKQSLTELSGGQRSLIALSLIMALLQFKPAPMYILDEIDAALDLSHTQHIGHLFKNRFKGSQFIVVSLKEGLFTNANVLFRTRFRDGTSIVERTVDRSGSSLYTNTQQGDAEDNGGGRRARRGVAAVA
ncbi:condensin complex subunit SMC2 [Paxillus ammoniavirescens]|nr:condensin complex subunit SMC2 [Paxillus ammoniavirescens]